MKAPALTGYVGDAQSLGHTPSTADTFRIQFWQNSGKTPETLSERFLEFPWRVRLGSPKPHNSRHLRLPEHFHDYLPPSTAGGASFSEEVLERASQSCCHGIPSSAEAISDFPDRIQGFPAEIRGQFLSFSGGGDLGSRAFALVPTSRASSTRSRSLLSTTKMIPFVLL